MFTESDLASAAQLASFADETPEGRSIVVLAKEKYGLRGRETGSAQSELHTVFGADLHVCVDLDGHEIRKGAPQAIEKYVAERGQIVPPEMKQVIREIANGGGHTVIVTDNRHVLGRHRPDGRSQGRNAREISIICGHGHPHND